MKVIQSDVLDVNLKPESYDCFLSDPPYGIGFKGQDWDQGVPSPLHWKNIFDSLKPGAFGLVYSGTKNFWSMGLSLNSAGFDVVDTLVWLYSQGFPAGNHNVSKSLDKKLGQKRQKEKVKVTSRNVLHGVNRPWLDKALETGYHELDSDKPISKMASLFKGYGTRINPAYEPIFLVRKPTTLSYADNVLEHRCGVLNIDGARIPTEDDLTRKNNGLIYDGVVLNKSKTSGKGEVYNKDVTGRWPKNVIFDEHASCDLGDRKRYFYCAKVNRNERDKGLEKGENNHPTLKPIELNTYLATILLLPFQESRILVPYSGAGSELIGAKLAGFNNITGVEKEEKFVKLSNKRFLIFTKEA